MTVKTLYTCDKCGNVQETPKQFWTVRVIANHIKYPSQAFVKDKFIQVCRFCLESFGLCVHTKPDEPPPKFPTLEELIREIVQRCQEEQ